MMHSSSSSAANTSKFKLFEKFDINNLQTELRKSCNTGQTNRSTQCHQYQHVNDNNNNKMDSSTPNNGNECDSIEWQMRSTMFVGCLLFALLSGLLASLFTMEHLINMLGIGTLLMLYSLTIDIIILRYSIYMKHLMHQLPNQNGNPIGSKPSNSMSLISILLCVYCTLSACLAMFMQAIFHELWTISNAVSITLIVMLMVGLLAICYIMGIQLKRNAIFELSILKNPLYPAIALFGCIFLFTSFSVWAWYRFGVWTIIGCLLYLILKRFSSTTHRTKSTASEISNNGFISDDEPSKRTSSKITLKLENDPSTNGISVQHTNQITTNIIQINDGTETIKMHAIESVECRAMEIKCNENVENSVKPQPAYEMITTETQMVQQYGHRSSVQKKYDEISNADDIREHCIEKREPNGNIYFIEMNSSLNGNHETASNSDSSSSNDKQNEKLSMENVLNGCDIEFQMESKSKQQQQQQQQQHPTVQDVHSFNECNFEDEQIVKAVVHVSVETLIQNEIDSNDVKIMQTIQPQMNEISVKNCKPIPIKAIKAIERSIDRPEKLSFRIDAYEALPKQKLLFENDDKRTAFKIRLENLFGQNERQPLNRITSNKPMTIANSIRFTNSAPNSLILMNSNNDSTMTATNPQCQSNLPLDSNDGAPNIRSSANIPIAPIFNQHLYDTVGYRNNTKTYQTAMSTPCSVHEIDIGVIPMLSAAKKPNLSRSHAHENLTIIGQNGDNNNNLDSMDVDGTDSASETIKQKLEEIFGRGRTQAQNDVDNYGAASDTLDPNNSIVMRKIKPIEPFDTVKRQKLIFSNVLKSIRSDGSINLRRTSSITSTDIKSIQSTDAVI